MEFGITCWGASKNKKSRILKILKKKAKRTVFKFKLQCTYNFTFWKTKYFETA